MDHVLHGFSDEKAVCISASVKANSKTSPLSVPSKSQRTQDDSTLKRVTYHCLMNVSQLTKHGKNYLQCQPLPCSSRELFSNMTAGSAMTLSTYCLYLGVNSLECSVGRNLV